jgi:hypothetical protein
MAGPNQSEQPYRPPKLTFGLELELDFAVPRDNYAI